MNEEEQCHAILKQAVDLLQQAAKIMARVTGQPPAQLGRHQLVVESIIHSAAFQFRIEPPEMYSPKRYFNLALARHIAMYLIRQHTPLSCLEVASVFHKVDHGIVLHAERRVKNELGLGLQPVVDQIEVRARSHWQVPSNLPLTNSSPNLSLPL